jgi:serine/threonine protein phosphatase PrpC
MFLRLRHHDRPPGTTQQASMQMLGGTGEVKVAQQALALQVGTGLHPGIKHAQEPNEDMLSVTHGVIPALAFKPFDLLIVADGMGGQADGQEASRLAVETFSRYMSEALRSQGVTAESFLPLIKAGVQSANRAVHLRNQEHYSNMGTTMTAALVVDATAYVAHVGDSRLYLYHEPIGLAQITQDHSLVAALASAGMIRPEDIYTHPRRNIIYRCLGEKAKVEVDTYTVALAAGDTLLLCSDGLWEMVRDSQIAALLASPVRNPSQIAHDLVQAALVGGGEDNISAVVARVAGAGGSDLH